MKKAVFELEVNTGNSVNDLKAAKETVDSFKSALEKAGDAANKSFAGGDMQKALEDVGKHIEESKHSLSSYSRAIKEYQSIALAAGRESPVGREAIARAAELKDRIGDLQAEIQATSHDAINMQAGLQLGETILSGYGAVQGAMSLLGNESEDLQKQLVKLQAVTALLTSVEQIRQNLEKESFLMLKAKAVSTKLLTSATLAYNAVVGTSTGLLKAFKIALAATGIGAVLVGLGLLIANFEQVSKWVENLVSRIPVLSNVLAKLGLIQSEQERAAKKRVDAVMSEIDAINKKIKAITEARDKELAAIDDTVREIDRELKIRGAAGEDVSVLERQRIEQILERVRVEREAIEEVIRLRQQEVEALRSLDSKFYKFGADVLEKRNNEKIKEQKELAEKEKDILADLAAFEAKKNKERYDSYKKVQEERKRQLEEEKKRQFNEMRKRNKEEVESMLDLLKELQQGEKQREERRKKNVQDEMKVITVSNEQMYNFFLDWLQRSSDAIDEFIDSKRRKELIDFTVETTKAGLEAIISLTEAFEGKSRAQQRRAFNIRKAASVSLATIETFQAAQSAFASQVIPNDPSSFVRGVIAATIATASGLARVKQILATRFEGGGASAVVIGAPPRLATVGEAQGAAKPQTPPGVPSVPEIVNNIQSVVSVVEINDAQNTLIKVDERRTL